MWLFVVITNEFWYQDTGPDQENKKNWFTPEQLMILQ